jgi:drug/metabolite transporter (DMT)-like permease
MSGVLWAIAAGLGFGIFQTLNRKAGEELDAMRGTFMLLAVSAIVLIIIALFTTDISLLWTMPIGAIAAFAVAGFIHFFLGWTLISISQNQIGAARTGAVVGSMPLFGLVIDVLIYREVFSWQALLGVFLVVAGVYIISMR